MAGWSLPARSLTTAWLAHLTTYLYTGMWRLGGPAIDVLPWLLLPFGLGLLAWMLARRREDGHRGHALIVHGAAAA